SGSTCPCLTERAKRDSSPPRSPPEPADMVDKTGVLFICMGNICRSPLAEGIFIHKARDRGVIDRFLVDSCGTGGWHVGERADPRARAVARKYNVELPSCARQLHLPTDF